MTREEYFDKPPLCENGCGNQIPFARVNKGAKYCGRICSVDALAKKARGQAKPPRLPATAEWNGKVKQVEVPHKITFGW